jgi:hypothetical protein
VTGEPALVDPKTREAAGFRRLEVHPIHGAVAPAELHDVEMLWPQIAVDDDARWRVKR